MSLQPFIDLPPVKTNPLPSAAPRPLPAANAARSGSGRVRRSDRAPQPALRRVALDVRRPARVQPAVVASLVQFADLLAVLAAGIAACAIYFPASLPLSPLPALTAILVLALMTRAAKPDATRPAEITRQRCFEQFLAGAVYALAAFGFALVAGVAVLQPEPAPRARLVGWLLIWALFALVGVLATRVVLAVLLRRWRRGGRLKQLVAVYGTGDHAERLVQRFTAAPEEIEIVGVFDDRRGRGTPGLALCHQAHGTTDELVELSRQMKIDRVVVALPHSAEKRLLEILRKLHRMPVEISLAPDMVGFNVPAKNHQAYAGVPLLDVYGRPLTLGQTAAKAVFDRLAAALGVALLSPVLLLIALAIKLDSKGPVLFRQNRYGFGDRVIQVYKFRTMRADAADHDGERQTEVHDPRLTRIGGFLRRWSLDELPQLFNVLNGELSLVGPRPHAVSMHVRQRRNEDIVPDYALRHHVKPGITGWAQVNGYHGPVQTERALRQRVTYDLEYINDWSLWFDIRILLKTVLFAFGRRYAS
jgi:Undecaprenyl-phosphate glucose phosphotransferase